MSAGVVRAWDRGSSVVHRRLPARYPLVVGAVMLAIVVAACTSGRPLHRQITLESVPYQPRPAELTAVKLPVSAEEIATATARLPDTLLGQTSLPSSGWRTNDHFVASWGVPNGQAGKPPITLAIRHIDTLGNPSVATAVDAVIDEANRPHNIAGPVEVGRDGQMTWLQRNDAGYTVIWGRDDNPWLYVATASTEREIDTLLHAFATAAGRHSSGNVSTLR